MLIFSLRSGLGWEGLTKSDDPYFRVVLFYLHFFVFTYLHLDQLQEKKK